LNEDVCAQHAIVCGAAGYVSSLAATEVMLDAIRAVCMGDLFLNPQLAIRLLRQSIGRKPNQSPTMGPESLSDRELQVFQMLGAGLGTRQIATQLGISVKTVDTHRENMKHKLGAQDAVALLREAVHFVDSGDGEGRITPPEEAGPSQ
jgi:DNA-binding NarL/FixJ family response regulator